MSGKNSSAQTVLVVSAIFISSFYAGQRSYGITAPFSHSEAVIAVQSCGDDQFVGGCSSCSNCSAFEYEAGGCSYFKDTFCTLCEPISHCPQENIRCSTSSDERCSMCDPGYYDEDCKPCSVCDPGYWESTRCMQDQDTICSRCTECGNNEHITQACTYNSDSVCNTCRACKTAVLTESTEVGATEGPNYWKGTVCESPENTNWQFPMSVYTLGNDTVCQECTTPDHAVEASQGQEQVIGEFVVAPCTIDTDTVIQQCTVCPCGAKNQFETLAETKYRGENCMYEDPMQPCVTSLAFGINGTYEQQGTDTVCIPCTQQSDNGDEWEVFPCGGKSDALWQECGECQRGEYAGENCSIQKDVSCPDCTLESDYGALENCKDGELVCTNESDSTCEDCKDGFMGETCCYHKYYGACGSLSTRERAANRGGFEGSTGADFAAFCMELCDEFPDCMAFELEDAGTSLDEQGDQSYYTGGASSICYFKSAYSQEDCSRASPDCDMVTLTRFKSSDPSKDCFSNVCRQNQSFKAYYAEAYPVDRPGGR